MKLLFMTSSLPQICKEEQPVILVGGGSVLVDPDWKLSGASDFIKPDHFQSANAVGAALGKVSGVLDQVFSLEGKTEEQVMSKAVDAAYLEAEKNGAQPGTIEIIDKMAVKLAYLPGNVTRIEVKVVGDLADTAGTAVDPGCFQKNGCYIYDLMHYSLEKQFQICHSQPLSPTIQPCGWLTC